VEHRLLTLGGSGDVQGLPAQALVADRLLSGGVELRVEPVRFASVPLPLMWLSDVQLSAGLDAGVAREAGAAGARASALGWSGGLAVVADVLGARPSLLGLWVAGPIRVAPASLDQAPGPELYLRIDSSY
jgi:hypothetical protein